ncbi:hypothetical protein ACRC7T_06385 [Segnochrobactraceae bacterium EtOH-i3]
MTNEPDWKWYAGTNEEEYEYGPFDTREDAIEEAASDDIQIIFVVEAYKDNPDAWSFTGSRNEEVVDLSGREGAA